MSNDAELNFKVNKLSKFLSFSVIDYAYKNEFVNENPVAQSIVESKFQFWSECKGYKELQMWSLLFSH